MVLKKVDEAAVHRNTIEPQPGANPNHPVISQPIERDVEIPLRSSQLIERLTLSDDYVYLHENDLKLVKPMSLFLLMKQCLV